MHLRETLAKKWLGKKGWADNDDEWGDFDQEICYDIYSLDVCL